MLMGIDLLHQSLIRVGDRAKRGTKKNVPEQSQVCTLRSDLICQRPLKYDNNLSASFEQPRESKDDLESYLDI